ncbi:MAG: amino acid permease [Croceibacterium sp.]
MFGRVKSLDAILATAEKKSLNRSLGAFQLTMLGIGAVIGTGIFVLTAEAAQKAGPGMMISFIIAGVVCAVAALCYAEMASMVPVSGSAYTYSYAVMGEMVAWMVGWALILEYAVAAGAVSVGWSGYMIGYVEHLIGSDISDAWTLGPFDGGMINLPAAIIALFVTLLLIRGTKESATANAVLVAIKIIALTLFVILAVPVMKMENFEPFSPLGFGGISAAAASIFFAYVGFDAVSTAAEETKNPQRNMPIGLIGSLGICTIFYLLVAAGVIGTVGAQPVGLAGGEVLEPGSRELTAACSAIGDQAVVCSKEALAWTLREIGWPQIGNLVGLAAILALPSVILMMMFGQTRIFFVMSRDGLLPPILSKVHPKFHTPHVITIITGVFVSLFAAFFPVGVLADISNSGTLFAFAMVAIAVLVLRRTDPLRKLPFRVPAIILVAPLAAIGCV